MALLLFQKKDRKVDNYDSLHVTVFVRVIICECHQGVDRLLQEVKNSLYFNIFFTFPKDSIIGKIGKK